MFGRSFLPPIIRVVVVPAGAFVSPILIHQTAPQKSHMMVIVIDTRLITSNHTRMTCVGCMYFATMVLGEKFELKEIFKINFCYWLIEHCVMMYGVENV
jgi:hypothetical protein